MQSILQDEKKCYITERTDNLHKHHIYGGNKNRKISDCNGFWVWLTAEYHNMSNKGVHFDKHLDRFLKMECQKEFEKTHTREEFRALIGKSYL